MYIPVFSDSCSLFTNLYQYGWLCRAVWSIFNNSETEILVSKYRFYPKVIMSALCNLESSRAIEWLTVCEAFVLIGLLQCSITVKIFSAEGWWLNAQTKDCGPTMLFILVLSEQIVLLGLGGEDKYKKIKYKYKLIKLRWCLTGWNTE